MTADGFNANTFPPMSSATLCTEAWHGTMVDDPGVWPKVVGHSHARTVASRVKRSCASNPERVLHNHCPQTSCVGWEHLLSYIGYDRIVMMMIWLWVKIEDLYTFHVFWVILEYEASILGTIAINYKALTGRLESNIEREKLNSVTTDIPCIGFQPAFWVGRSAHPCPPCSQYYHPHYPTGEANEAGCKIPELKGGSKGKSIYKWGDFPLPCLTIQGYYSPYSCQ